MVDLTSQSPCVGLLPVAQGGLTLQEVRPAAIIALLPLPGARPRVWPAPGCSVDTPQGRLIWAGRELAFHLGPPPETPQGAVAVDQSDAWATVRLSGAGAEEVLARLVPLDLRPRAFPEGAVARSLLGHMSVILMRHEGALEIMAFRSVAGTLVHEIADAMAAVAARRARD